MKFLLMMFASIRSILEIAQISISWLDEGNKMMINCAISEINAVKHKCSLVPSIICLTLCGPWSWSGTWQNISCKNLIRLAYEISILFSSFYLQFLSYVHTSTFEVDTSPNYISTQHSDWTRYFKQQKIFVVLSIVWLGNDQSGGPWTVAQLAAMLQVLFGWNWDEETSETISLNNCVW